MTSPENIKANAPIGSIREAKGEGVGYWSVVSKALPFATDILRLLLEPETRLSGPNTLPNRPRLPLKPFDEGRPAIRGSANSGFAP